jgi:hypothetical protein
MAELDAKAEADRLSFTSFWKKSKEALTGKQITFVSTNAVGQPVTCKYQAFFPFFFFSAHPLQRLILNRPGSDSRRRDGDVEP